MNELYHATGHFLSIFPWMTEAKYFDRVDSTQKRVLQFLPKSESGAVLIVSDAQTKGVGRQGRSWVSPTGGIWMTVAFPMGKREPGQMASFSPVAALVVVQALKEVNNLACKVKWPNDVEYHGKKLAGILINSVVKRKQSWFLVGVGVNVNNDLPPELEKEAISIRKIRGQTQGRSRLIEAILGGLWQAWEDYDRTGFGPYQKDFETNLVGQGTKVRLQVGKQIIQGTVLGVDPQGALSLKIGSRTKIITAGEILD